MKPGTPEWHYVATAMLSVFGLVPAWAVYRRRYQEAISVQPTFQPGAPDDGSRLKVKLRRECSNKIGIQSVRLSWSRGQQYVQADAEGMQPCVLDTDSPEGLYCLGDIAPIQIEEALRHRDLRLEVYSSSTGRRPLHKITGKSIRNIVQAYLDNQNAYYTKHGYDRSDAHPEPCIITGGPRRIMGGPDDPFRD